MSERSSCTSCGAPILWVETQNGKRMPLDFTPDRRFVIDAGDGMLARLRNTYASHFATCPNAESHRRSRQGGPHG